VIHVVTRQGVTAAVQALIQVASGTGTGLCQRARVGRHSIIPPKPYISNLKIPLNRRTNGGHVRIFQQKWF